jgi:uncharacterized protein YkuJ
MSQSSPRSESTNQTGAPIQPVNPNEANSSSNSNSYEYENNLTQEEINKLNEQRKQKQDYLKSEILKNGYKPEQFSEYISNLKENGQNIDNWQLNELKMVVMAFKSNPENSKRVDYLKSDDDLFEDLDLTKFEIFKEKETRKREVSLDDLGTKIEKGDLLGGFAEEVVEEEEFYDDDDIDLEMEMAKEMAERSFSPMIRTEFFGLLFRREDGLQSWSCDA